MAATMIWAAPVAAQEGGVLDTDAFVAAVTSLEGDAATEAFADLADAPEVHRDLLTWLYLRDSDTKATFETYRAFLDRRAHWPGNDRIRAAAERAMDDTLSGTEVLSFFAEAEVQTGQGAVAYARALNDAGRRDEAEAMLVDVWTHDALSDSSFRAIMDAFPDVVAPHHATRADMLLWRWRTSDAENVLPLLNEGDQALIRARMAILKRADDVTERIELVPERLMSAPGLVYDRFNWFADRGDWTEAMSILLKASTDAEALGIPWRWGSWRRTLARWQMREGEIERAYRIASEHHIAPDETNYSDLEWLSGYLALTYFKDYERALEHFRNFDASITSPISKGRAGYWIGRAHEGLGDANAAVAAFHQGAMHQTSFYGLLSAEKLGLTLNPEIVGGEDYSNWQSSPMLEDDLVQAGLALLDANERGLAVLFFVEAAKTLDRVEIGHLGQLLMDRDEPFFTVLVAKSAVRNDVLVQDAYFPVHPLAGMDLPVDPALALAIARQESEFREDAGSGVGALGLMQLMPDTAREVAGNLDMPFSQGRLTTDWAYNVALGSEYLSYLQGQFGNSPVMIAAGYNAGPSRPRRWMADRGDPRRGFGNPDAVDIIDWIEHIPFRETRNYVMRVTEGIPVYRARLTGEIGPVRFTDLLIGQQPMIRPRMRPDDLARAPVEDAAALEPEAPPADEAAPATPASPAAPAPVRPVARAGDR
ncbi:lytic transglycosylase domain-containing protein [Thalassorhabdomicrobium marinisediminis]|uniref:lytic transglycosylase domain-containing protein n=1 Tax=Thalassorhabdomicrobium marinisediminis TaxID=2170577 RepID=UPI00248F81FD|nr:lytic transglycosylase domain-containing protein [Thalassorhabdomicrobium marinisediminis]